MDSSAPVSESHLSSGPRAGIDLQKGAHCLALAVPILGTSHTLSHCGRQFITFNEHKILQDMTIKVKHQWAAMDVPSNCCFSSFFPQDYSKG